MSFQVYDYRNDIGNMLVTPWIRSRFLRMEPGASADLHSHDLGHEIFLVLAGRAEFTINGGVREVGPGQLCIALADEIHSVRTVGDEPMTMYLSVTPHIQPTHTGRTADGERMPTRFAPSRSYDVAPDDTAPMAEIVDVCLEASRALARDAEAFASVHELNADRLRGHNRDDAVEAREAVWGALYKVFRQAYDLADGWNALADRVERMPDGKRG